jgi:hypothetical protein
MLDLSLPIPQFFLSYFHFSILFNYFFLSFTFTFSLSSIFNITSLNVQLHLGYDSYNHSFVFIHLGSHFLIERLFYLQKFRGNQFISMCLIPSSLEHGSNYGPYLQLWIMALATSSSYVSWLYCSRST